MEYSRESLDRIEKIEKLKKAGVIPYANNFRGKIDIYKIRLDESKSKDVEFLMENGSVGEFKTAGRLISFKSHGKLAFGKIIDNTEAIQVCFMKDKFKFNTGKKIVENLEIDGEEKNSYKIIEKFVNIGDYIGVIGDLFFTKHGELTIFVKEFQILSKAVRPLPEKFHGIQDQESIYRQRYLDMIMNEESYARMLLRSKFIKTLRDFYYENDFIEIETPVLGNSASGAAAKPFITHHNDFDDDFYLRISPETALKKATVGRLERVVEFAKEFRNEGSDPSHLQEFSAIEHYATWWNFEDNIKFTEDMFDYIFDKLKLDRKIELKDKEGNIKEVDFTTPWEKVDYVEGVNKASGLDITSYGEFDEEKLISDIKSKGIEFAGIENMSVPTLIDYLYKKVLRPKIVGPAIIYNYPKLMQPLARQSDKNPNIVEQFQVVVNGWEIVKAYSELVDPKIQRDNFEMQAKAMEKGDEEATSPDEDFVLAMEYGMPCQSGWGMGIDRVLALLTKQDNLRDVILFPLMKSDKPKLSKKEQENIYRRKKIVVIADETLPSGVIANAIGQLGISIGGHSQEKLFEANILHDADLNIHYTDCFYGMSNLAGNRDEMAKFVEKCYNSNIQVFDFSDIMRKAHFDEEMQKGYKEKSTKDIGYIAVGALISSNFEKEFLDSLKKFGE